MKQSLLLLKTRKQAPADEVSVNAQLLIRAGYVHKELAGVYSFLPLGLRVLNKINNIIRQEMNNIGAQELFLTVLQNPEIWQKTNRWFDDVVDIWFKTQLKNDQELGLGFTHEESIANLVKDYIKSYKDLPKYVYQIQTKFRNEIRAKSGIMRCREFFMKDMYSFNKSEEELDEFYEKVKQAYFKIFDRCGLGNLTYLTFSSGGTFSKYSHEFQVVTDAGEDIIYLDRQKKIAVNKEVYTTEVLNDLGLHKDDLEEVKAVEVGNIFKQKTKFSEPLDLKFVDKDGQEKPVIMGAYGIGPARLMGTIVEIHHDENGIIWPKEVAPFQIHLLALVKDKNELDKAEQLYQDLKNKGFEVLFDDRLDVRAGEKLAEADLLGLPIRLVISSKTLSNNQVEYKKRDKQEIKLLEFNQVSAYCQNYV